MGTTDVTIMKHIIILSGIMSIFTCILIRV